MKKAIALLITISILMGVSGCALSELVSQAPTATPTPSRTPKPTFTPLVIEAPIPEATPTATSTSVVVPTDTPALTPSPTATLAATNTPIPPPTATSPPSPPTATPTNTPAPVVKPCYYVEGSREGGAAGKPSEGTTPSSVFEGYVIDTAGNGLNNYGVWFEHPSVGTHCVTTGDPANLWDQWPGYWKHEFWAALGTETTYYITIKESCAPGASAKSDKVDFPYKYWGSGHHENITFVCSF